MLVSYDVLIKKAKVLTRLKFKVQELRLLLFLEGVDYGCITDARRKFGIAQIAATATKFTVI